MKMRVLFPAGVAPYLAEDPIAGDIVELPAPIAESLANDGWLELPEQIEQATAAPGEKRRVSRVRKKKATGRIRKKER